MASDSRAAIKKVLRSGDDYYAILGVDKQSDESAIKKAYKKLALQLHPDKCQEEGSEEAFKKVGEAVSVLSDPQKRQRYDQFGVEALREGGGGPGHGGVSPEDIFEAFFGGHAGGAAFMQTGGMGGFQQVKFSTGGPGGVHFMHFSTGGMGGPRQRRAAPAAREEREREEEPHVELSAWMRHAQLVAAALGPLMPVVVLGLFAVVMTVVLTLMGTIAKFVMSRGYIIVPILYVFEGRIKLVLLAAVTVLAIFGIL